MLISITYTASQNGVLRHKNTVPWENTEELRCDDFIKASRTRLLVLGRFSFEALKINLDCDFLVLSTTQTGISVGGVRYVATLAQAIEIGRAGGYKEMIISGGRPLIAEAMLIADIIYKSTILVEPQGTVYAPAIPVHFHLVWGKNIKGNPSHSYQTYTLAEHRKLKFDLVGLLLP